MSSPKKELLINTPSFQSLMGEIAQDYESDLRFQNAAVAALTEAKSPIIMDSQYRGTVATVGTQLAKEALESNLFSETNSTNKRSRTSQ